jgi:hypothetical protein
MHEFEKAETTKLQTTILDRSQMPECSAALSARDERSPDERGKLTFANIDLR